MEEKRIVLSGNPVSSGIAVANAYVYHQQEFVVKEGYFEEGKESENLDIFHDAAFRAKEELSGVYGLLEQEDKERAKIFLAHSEILEDEEIREEIEMAIREERMNPDYAIEKVFEEFALLLSKVDDPLIAGRVSDIRDVKKRLLRICMGKEDKNLSTLPEDVIVVAHDLLPSDTATLDRKHVKGIITEIGGTNSHSAILARSFQIPAVLGLTNACKQIKNGVRLGVDAITGVVIVSPNEEDIRLLWEKEKEFKRKQQEEALYLDQPCKTKDGHVIQIGMNLGTTEFDVPKSYFDFVGLFRTEFLYMENTHLPTEEEQFEAYKKVLENAKGNTVTLRTLDIGGDKTLPYMELPKEENPFLGKRAIRLCFAEDTVFMTQLKAALRASAYGPLQIMFPMIGSMEEIMRAKKYVKDVMQQLDEEDIPYDKQIKLGIMIEVPSIALIADMVAEEVDFASIGSNDLTQYICAADRMNPEVTSYYQNYAPAMFRLIGYIFESFEQKGKAVSVCGEMAGNPDAARVLVGLGAKKLSMSSGNIAGVKAALAKIDMKDAKEMAKKCKQLRTEEEVKEYFLNKIQ